jgi:uncharacterized iron-regulated protein
MLKNARGEYRRRGWPVAALGLAASLGCVLGCAAHQHPGDADIGSSRDVDQSGMDRETIVQTERPPAPPEDVVQKAGRPFTGYRTADALVLEPEELFTYLAAADAVCIGERHDDALDHFAQWRTLQGFAERRLLRGFELGIGLEMVSREQQLALSEYLAGHTDREHFVATTDWDHMWGFPIQYYDPQFVEARARGVRGLSLAVPDRIVNRVAREGLAAISKNDGRRIPPLDLTDQTHRQLFDALMQGHPLPDDAVADHYYQAQVVRDESMALFSKNWLLEHRPLRKLLIFAGVAHCHHNAIPSRMERENGLVVVNLIAAKKTPYRSTGKTADDLVYAGYEYQIVFDE